MSLSRVHFQQWDRHTSEDRGGDAPAADDDKMMTVVMAMMVVVMMVVMAMMVVVMMMVVHFQQSRHTPDVFAHPHAAGGWLLDETDCVTWEFGHFNFFFVFCPPSVIQAVSVERN